MFKHHERESYGDSEMSTPVRPRERSDQNILEPMRGFTEVRDLEIDERVFQIRMASTECGRSHASSLIHRMYASRGYTVTDALPESPNRVTVTISEHEEVIGTITLGIDSPMGILADEIFSEEVDDFRRRGRKVCELTKLAFDPSTRSKIALASLFHIIFIYLRRVQKCTDIFIEVNPRHRRFYERMLGFKKFGPKKMNMRVNAPAYLLCVETAYVEEQIQKHGGTFGRTDAEKSLYPYFFCPISEQQNKVTIEKYLNILRDDPSNATAVNDLAWTYQASRGPTTAFRSDQSH